MSILKIQTGKDNPILRKKSAKIGQIAKTTAKLAADMKETLAKEDGLGLAAPQVGQNVRVIVVKIESTYVPMINPEITRKSAETDVREEGCLSLPKTYCEIERAKEITVKFQDLKGGGQVLKLEDLPARVAQHEVDHLEGVLIMDY